LIGDAQRGNQSRLKRNKSFVMHWSDDL